MSYDTGAMDKQSELLGPNLTAHLIPEVESKLLELLGQLTPEDWETPTISPRWKVKDVAAHLLDTQLRKLSIARDRHVTEIPVIHSAADLAAFIDRLNQEGVDALSPPESDGSHLSDGSRLDREREVSPIAGSLRPGNFCSELGWRRDIAQLVRYSPRIDGTLAPPTTNQARRKSAWNHDTGALSPVLDCFMRALPYTYRNILADPGTLLQFDISGECGGTWCLLCQSIGWQLVKPSLGKATSRVTIPQEIAWRVFTKGIDRKTALAQAQAEGDPELGLHILRMIAIVA